MTLLESRRSCQLPIYECLPMWSLYVFWFFLGGWWSEVINRILTLLMAPLKYFNGTNTRLYQFHKLVNHVLLHFIFILQLSGINILTSFFDVIYYSYPMRIKTSSFITLFLPLIRSSIAPHFKNFNVINVFLFQNQVSKPYSGVGKI